MQERLFSAPQNAKNGGRKAHIDCPNATKKGESYGALGDDKPRVWDAHLVDRDSPGCGCRGSHPLTHVDRKPSDGFHSDRRH